MQKNSVLKKIVLIFKGMIVGFGAIMPGVSGGTLCVAFGMYKPLLNVMSNPKKAIAKDGLKLLLFIIGVALGFVGLSGLAGSLLKENSFITTLVFIGLIIGTIPSLWTGAGKKGRGISSFVAMAVGFVFLLIILIFINSSEHISVESNFWGFILCGVLWGISFIVPGLSSSTFLLFFGLYQPMLEGISKLSPMVILPIGIGMIISLVSLSSAVNAAYRRWYPQVSHAILGIVAASTLCIIPAETFTSTSNIMIGILSIVCGALASFFIVKLCDSISESK